MKIWWAALAACILVSALTPKAKSEIAMADDPVAHAKGRKLVKALKTEITDPGSAQFDDMRLNGSKLCGWINYKNIYGGYNGYTQFGFDPESEELVIVPPIFDPKVPAKEKEAAQAPALKRVLEMCGLSVEEELRNYVRKAKP